MIPSYIPTYFPSKHPSYPSMTPTKVSTGVPTDIATSEPTGKRFCVELQIESDCHIHDISWTISVDSTKLNGDVNISTIIDKQGCVARIEDKCFNLEIFHDFFGDELLFGQGNWTLIFENYTAPSFTNGIIHFQIQVMIHLY